MQEEPTLMSERPATRNARTKAVLITGAGGEMGHGLIQALSGSYENTPIVALDLRPIPNDLERHCTESVAADVREVEIFDSLAERYQFTAIYHLAAMLSASAERSPFRACDVNIGGTMNLLRIAAAENEHASNGEQTLFFFPSTIAVYGLRSFEAKRLAGAVSENDCLEPRTIYGCNKLAAEHLGRYFSSHHGQVDRPLGEAGTIDFRALRFPGLISPHTLPTGGTTDYGPEMLHAAAGARHYECFVRADSTLPFMTMEEATRAVLELCAAPRESLSETTYNVRSFAPSAQDICDTVRTHFPKHTCSFEPNEGLQAVVDGWPQDTCDQRAQDDWNWEPTYTLESAFAEELVPAIASRNA